MNPASHRQPATDDPIDYGRATVRLLDAIEAICDPTAAFADQVASALEAVLYRVASDPDVAALLTVSFPSSEPPDSRSTLTRALTGRLRAAVERHPGLRTPPPFVEPHLINGIGSLIARRLDCEGPEHLSDLAPSLLKWVLFYYLPAEAPIDSSDFGEIAIAQPAGAGH